MTSPGARGPRRVPAAEVVLFPIVKLQVRISGSAWAGHTTGAVGSCRNPQAQHPPLGGLPLLFEIH